MQGASYSLSVKKKSGFIVLDLESGQILHAQEGKDAQALVPFLEKLKRKKVPLLAIAMDMSPAYFQAVRQVFPKVDIVHDPYHVVSLVNKAIDETRPDIARELNNQDKQVIKGSRFLLLRGLESLNAYSLSKLKDLMEVNEPLYAAYLLNEGLRTFWNQPNEQSGAVFLDTWITQASSFTLSLFTKLAETLQRHRGELLSYFRHRISTGPLEGINNKNKVLKRQAYGFRDKLYFKLRLFFLHQQTPAFAG
ncbi:MAG: ISL3 family transposase [Syntrophales bacterium LBB04]|nr:ISL3 family transposase [Syntrophales bacterium LBB04]